MTAKTPSGASPSADTDTVGNLQASIQDRKAFSTLDDYVCLCTAYLRYLESDAPTRIISPTHPNYVFYQYGQKHGHPITRPLNTDLFIGTASDFEEAYGRFSSLLLDLQTHQEAAARRAANRVCIEANEVNKVIYTIQQSIGAIGDSFDNANQARKRIGQLFENLIQLTILETGLECEPRTIRIPLPEGLGQTMSYELDLVFSRNKAIVASETMHIHPHEVVGSVKTTSKDRIDKIFLDKYLLTKLLGRDIPVVAIFLHDVQRAIRGNSIFGINSTFKTNHFLGYTIALNRLDGVYYVDPRPEMRASPRLRDQIYDFQQFLTTDLWALSSR